MIDFPVILVDEFYLSSHVIRESGIENLYQWKDTAECWYFPQTDQQQQRYQGSYEKPKSRRFGYAALLHELVFDSHSIDLICDSLLGLDNNLLTIERIQMLMQAVVDDSEKAQIMVCFHLICLSLTLRNSWRKMVTI